jgi:nucleotide-binding universal stress UspA family protein
MPTSTTHRGIVVGVDGSPPAKVAVDWAAREAAMRNVGLTLVHVVPSPMAEMWFDMPPPPQLSEAFEKHGQDVVREAREVAEQATKRSGVIQVQSEMPTGSALPILTDMSKDAEMICGRLASWSATGRPISWWSCRSPRNWWLSAAMAAAALPGCCWVR